MDRSQNELESGIPSDFRWCSAALPSLVGESVL
jgi:hypothetical protein